MQPPPAPRMRSKIDSLIFMSDSIEPTKSEQSVKSLYSAPQSEAPEVRRDVTDKETEVEVEVENVERPVDLYKVIFSLFDTQRRFYFRLA